MLLTTATGTALLSILSFTFGYSNGYTPQHTKVEPEVTITPENLEQFPIIEPKLAVRPLILPNGYALTSDETTMIAKSDINLIVVEDPTDEYIVTLKNLFKTMAVQELNGVTYTYCRNSELADNNDTDGLALLGPDFLSKDECEKKQKTYTVEKISCDIKDSKCQLQFLALKQSQGDVSYIYTVRNPLFALFNTPTPKIESPYGTYIFTWGSSMYPFTLTSYSVEVLDEKGKRVYASGKLSTATDGDYFTPTSELKAQTLTTRFRFWYKTGKTTFSSPQIVEKTFNYSPPVTTTAETSKSKAKQISWIPDWGMNEGIESIRKDPKKWDTISPVWFVPNKNGTLDKKPTLNSPTLLKLLKDNKIKLVPTISTFDADVVKEILNKNFNKHIDEIVRLVEKNGYDGIDLDYESTYEDDKTLLLQFVTKLADELHKKGKILSFTALPKIDDRRIYAFLPQTHVAQDWKGIGAVVDEFRIMAYDFTGQGSLQPGPLSPVQWNETLIRYALAQMPREKIVLALPLYSHGWPKPKSANLAGSNNDKSLSSGEQKNTISLQHDSIDYVKSHSSYYKEQYDPWTKEVRAEFKYNGVERVMYYLDKQSVDNRIKLAERYGIKGICYWRIGGEKL